jgi:transposase
MEKELEQFQQEAQRLKEGRKGGALPFPEALRAFAVRYAEQTVEGGGTVVEAAAKLGVSAPTLYEWRKGVTVRRTPYGELMSRSQSPTEQHSVPSP